ncbi:MAG: HXXEE domain-containing protein [bacterium]|nr:HXXEE domain-containing protein [bacterium]
MASLETVFAILLGIQFLHSIEELSTGFHKQFPLGAMKFRTFLAFEIIFLGFWITVFFMKGFLYRESLMAFFNVLMFANGLWHMVWWGIVKRYVPGLVTAPLFVITFLVFYFQTLFR